MKHKGQIFTSISRNFWYLIFFTFFSVVCLMIGFNLHLYRTYIKERLELLPKEAIHIDYILNDSIIYMEHYAHLIGKRIAENGVADLEYIASLLSVDFKTSHDPNKIFIHSLFDWVTPDKKMLVSSNGVLAQPLDMSHREYLKRTVKFPWTLQLQDPAVGIPSGQWIIPGGMGITDKKGKFLGSVTLGFAIDRLAKKITAAIGTDLRFIILTKDLQYVGSSAGGNTSDDHDLFIKIFSKKNLELKEQAGFFKEPVLFLEDIYPYFYQTSKYNYIILTGYSHKLPGRIFNQILLPRILEFLLIGTIMIALLVVLRIRTIQPLIQLSEMVNKISNGEKSPPPLKSNIIEIRNLSRAIMNMRRAFLRERSLKNKLRKAHHLAESSSAAKTDFLSSTAHELRSPLNAIIGMSEAIRNKIFGENIDKYIEYAVDIEQSGHELLEFIEDLLDINKSESGQFTLDEEEFIDIENIINRAIKLNLSRANKSNILIKTHIEGGIPQLYADPRRIRQILINLISNSVKYSAENTMITISAIRREDKIALIVTDQGFGMNKEQVKTGLQKWGKVKNKHSGKFEASGLGLPLAKHLSDLHNCEFIIESKPDHGTIITIIFPKDRIREVR